jgi:hypothetical protein
MENPVRRIASLALFAGLVALCSTAPGQSNPAPAALPNAAALDKIAAYSGTWHIEIEHLDTAVSKAGKETTTLRNDCWRSAGFYACNQFVDGESKALLVFMNGIKDGDYVSHVIPAGDGPVSSGSLHIEGNTWTFPWDGVDQNNPMHFRVVNVFTAPGTIEYRQEFSRDLTQWTVSAKGIEHKVN